MPIPFFSCPSSNHGQDEIKFPRKSNNGNKISCSTSQCHFHPNSYIYITWITDIPHDTWILFAPR